MDNNIVSKERLLKAEENHLLDPEFLPHTLWENKSQTLILPPCIAQAYKILIEDHGLSTLAASRDPKNPPTGGFTKEKTDQHFAQAFDGSVARAQLALLDPKREINRTFNAFITVLSGNSITIVDAPCGAGAASFSFLSTIAELRAQSILPRLPLYVNLIGAELSELARQYAQEMLEKIQSALEKQAIFIKNKEFMDWDVTDQRSNTTLVKKMIETSAKTESSKLLIIANFNGFLEQEKKWDKSKNQIEEFFRYASEENNNQDKINLAIWIEPIMNEATASGGLFKKLFNLSKEKLKKFVQLLTQREDAQPYAMSSAKFRLPLDEKNTANVHLAVLDIVLERIS